MKFIAHRGNLKGKNPERENHPDYIDEAIEAGFDVEIDIWYESTPTSGTFWLGHNMPQYEVDLLWLRERSENLWCHAKNLEALYQLLHYGEINVFWHQEDDYTVTSQGYIWTYPDKPIIPLNFKQIMLLFEWTYDDNVIPHGGICSDEIILYKNKYKCC